MRFTSVLAPIAFAATVLADGAAITGALKTIDTTIKGLTGQITSFKGTTLFDAVPIGFTTLALNFDIQNGAKVAKASQPLTSDETVGLADVTATIITDATACIDALIAVKPQFDKIQLVTIATTLFVSTLQKSTADLGTAVVAKVPADFKEVAQQLIDQINAQFVRALTVYGGGAPTVSSRSSEIMMPVSFLA